MEVCKEWHINEKNKGVEVFILFLDKEILVSLKQTENFQSVLPYKMVCQICNNNLKKKEFHIVYDHRIIES